MTSTGRLAIGNSLRHVVPGEALFRERHEKGIYKEEMYASTRTIWERDSVESASLGPTLAHDAVRD